MLQFVIGQDSAGAAIKNLARQMHAEYPRAMAAGINRTSKFVETAAVREIQKDTAASSQKTIRRNLSMFKATAQKLIGGVQARSTKKDKIPVYELKPKPKTVAKRRPSVPGVSYGPRKKLIPHSFIAKMESGHVGVFVRTGRFTEAIRGRHVGEEREQITEAHGPSVALVFGRKKIKAALKRVVDDRLTAEVDKAFRHFTSKR